MPRLLNGRATGDILSALLLQGVILLTMTLLLPWIGCREGRRGPGSISQAQSVLEGTIPLDLSQSPRSSLTAA